MKARSNFLWSVRRELWEHRSSYLAPLAIALLALTGFAFHLGNWADAMRAVAALPPAKQVAVTVMPFGLMTSVILVTGWIVGVFYALDALYAERRDRSMLFWKSLPVSDLTTVLAKAAVPIVVITAIATAIALTAQLLLLAGGAAMLAARGIEAPLGSVTWVQTWIAMVYGVAVHSLWFAPAFGWLLLVSAWARRSPFLWAFLPIFAVWAVERITFGTSHVGTLIRDRVSGAMVVAFRGDATREPITQLAQLDPLRFLSSPGLWIGLAFAAVFLALAVYVRRSRDPE
jgi:ABC-2 type transport system permease protein